MRAVEAESPDPGHNHYRQPKLDQDQVHSEERVTCDHAADEPDQILSLVDDPAEGNGLLPARVYSNSRRCHSFISLIAGRDAMVEP